MTYEFKAWRNGDWAPKGFPGSYVLIHNGKQVGAMAGSIFDVMKIDTNPKHQGHGTQFVKLIIEEARKKEQEYHFGKQWITFLGVIGDSKDDRTVLEHILKDKFGFECIGNESWRLKL